jgi:hypothetical protein
MLIRYNYDQYIHAAYINWSDQLDKFSYQLGLRAEDAEYSGKNEGDSTVYLKNSFTNFFPSAFVNYQLPNQQSVYLNYSRRTNRPNFFQMLPYRDLSNPSTVSQGNPALIPEFIDNIEFSYNKLDKKGNNIIFSAYYQYTQNLIERITQPGTGAFADRLLVMPQNLASGTTYGVEGIANLKPAKWWDATVSANFFQNEIVIASSAASEISQYLSNKAGYGMFAKGNINIRLPKNISIQLNGNYESPKVVAQGKLRETAWMDVAVKKNVLKNKGTITINCSDVFKTHRFINDYMLNTYDQTINRVKETRIGNISFSYRFGKTEIGKNIASGKEKRRDDMKRPDEMKGKNGPPSSEDRGKNMKEGDDNDQGGGGGAPQGGGQGSKGK